MRRPPGTPASTLRRLLSLARDLLQSPDTNSILALTGPAIKELLSADGALLLLTLAGRDEVAEYDRSGSVQCPCDGSALHRYARQAIDQQTPILLPRLASAAIDDYGGHPARGTASLIAFPFPPIRPIGALVVFWHHRGHPNQLAKRITTLRYIGELASAAIGNAVLTHALGEQLSVKIGEIEAATLSHAREIERRDRVEEQLHRISVTDVMTGMLNRRGFFLHAERSLRIARRGKLPSAIIYADVDNLKSVNDQLGHEVGDNLIQDGGRILQRSFRDSDVVARVGGDEYAAFTLDAEHPEAILNRIRANIERFHLGSPRPYRISLSIGIVTCDPFSERPLSDYLSEADERMYEHKRSSAEGDGNN